MIEPLLRFAQEWANEGVQGEIEIRLAADLYCRLLCELADLRVYDYTSQHDGSSLLRTPYGITLRVRLAPA